MDYQEAKALIGQQLYWEEHGRRYIFLRTGILTDALKGKLEFDESGDYYPPSHYRNLTTEKHGGWE